MSNVFTVTLPDDVYEPERTYGWRQAKVEVVCPHLTPSRFREVVKELDAQLFSPCIVTLKDGWWYPSLYARYMQDGVQVTLCGPLAESPSYQERKAA